jgi:hypothetical protein
MAPDPRRPESAEYRGALKSAEYRGALKSAEYRGAEVR